MKNNQNLQVGALVNEAAGESYVVYAGLTQEGMVSTSGCTRTNQVAKASEDLKDLKDLGEGKKPR